MRICESFGVVHVSTGEMLRSAVEKRTPLGAKAAKIMEEGQLVSDEIIQGILAERLSCQDVEDGGVLLDGVPRTVTQAEDVEAILGNLGRRLNVAINLDVPIEVAKARMLSRGRKDDTPDAIMRRLKLYEAETAPLLEWFAERAALRNVNGVGSEDEVFERIKEAITDHS